MECSRKTKLLEQEGGESKPELLPAQLTEAEELGLDKLVKIQKPDDFLRVYQMANFLPKGCLIMLLCDHFNMQSIFFEINLPFIIALLMTAYINYHDPTHEMDETKFEARKKDIFTYVPLIAVYVTVCAFLRFSVISTVSENIAQAIRSDLYANYKQKFAKLPVDKIDFEESKNQFDLEKVDECIGAYQKDMEVYQPLKKKFMVKTLLGVFIMFYFDWKFALALVGCMVFFYLCLRGLDTSDRMGQNTIQDLRSVFNGLGHDVLFFDQSEKFKTETETICKYSKKGKYIGYFGQYFTVLMIYAIPIAYMAYALDQYTIYTNAKDECFKDVDCEDPGFPAFSGHVTGLSIQQICTFVLNALQLAANFHASRENLRGEAQNMEKVKEANEYLYSLIHLQPPLK